MLDLGLLYHDGDGCLAMTDVGHPVCIPEGTKAEKERGFWKETASWEWQFKPDIALKVSFEKGKYFSEGLLRYLPDKDQYQFTLQTIDKESLVFTGTKKEHQVSMERQDEKKKETQRVVLALLHSNRYLFNYEVKPDGKTCRFNPWPYPIA